MKAKDIRSKSDEEIKGDLKEVRRKLLDLKIKEAAKNSGRAPLEVRFLRRDIARMETVLREREIAQ
ncbi:MAG: 50S ribosomal protein L29 [Kiritimatiellaeota bacterium]|nr:50S ribosomal protein L29 [Kiritimatiellota bacterium]